MVRPTISPAERARRAPSGTAERQNRSMGAFTEECREPRGIRPRGTVEEIVARARANSGLDVDDAMALAVEETRRFREGNDD